LLYVQNAGEIKIKYHRPLPDGAEIKHVVVKRKNRKWYVCLQIEMPTPEPVVVGGPAVGIDMGLESLLAFNDGTLVENPRWLRASLRDLRVAQRRLSRRKKGSHRRRKAAQDVARLHEQIANRRRDFWHKLARDLVDTYSLIGLEDLTLGFMTRNHHLALSAHDAGLGEFQQLLAYKAEEAGVQDLASVQRVRRDCGKEFECSCTLLPSLWAEIEPGCQCGPECLNPRIERRSD
jgi:putative transposase